MFPFWELAIAPILEAVEARRVVEIGALRGETTVLMLERLGPDAELHVIDPVPDFDPDRARAASSPAATSSTATSASTCSPTCRRSTSRSSTATTTGTRSTTSCKTARRGAHRGPALPLPVLILHDVGVALRPPRPLLRPGQHPRGVPPAVREKGHASAATPELLGAAASTRRCTTPRSRAARATAS